MCFQRTTSRPFACLQFFMKKFVAERTACINAARMHACMLLSKRALKYGGHREREAQPAFCALVSAGSSTVAPPYSGRRKVRQLPPRLG